MCAYVSGSFKNEQPPNRTAESQTHHLENEPPENIGKQSCIDQEGRQCIYSWKDDFEKRFARMEEHVFKNSSRYDERNKNANTY